MLTGGVLRRISRIASAAFLWFLLVQALGFSQNDAPAAHRSGPERPNILLISIDSLRADHLHCYGYDRPTSPTIDGLATEGTLFQTCVAPTSWTLPSHLTMLTGLPPEEHGVFWDRAAIGPQAVFLAEVLKDSGYATAGFASGPYLGGSFGFTQGFDVYDESVIKGSWESHRGSTSPTTIGLVQTWLEAWSEGGKQKPFFLFVHMWDVHYDYAPPSPYNTLFDPHYSGTITADNYALGDHVHPDMDARDLEHVIALYDGEIRYTDRHLGRLLDSLKGLEVFEQTITVVTSDHGDEFFEHGQKGHRNALYDESLLVPLIFRYPARVAAGRVIGPQVRLMDLPVTLLSLAGVEIPENFGTPRPKVQYAERDLAVWMRPGDSAAKSWNELYAFSELERLQASIRTHRYKLIQNLLLPDQVELYDLVQDPGERKNLVEENPDLAAHLEQQLQSWRVNFESSGDLALQHQLSENQIRRLKFLGYLE